MRKIIDILSPLFSTGDQGETMSSITSLIYSVVNGCSSSILDPCLIGASMFAWWCGPLNPLLPGCPLSISVFFF
jgi:hypothetical protein